MNTPFDLRRKFFEALDSERACSWLRRRRQHRRNREMESRVMCDGLIHGSQIATEMLELTAHSS